MGILLTTSALVKTMSGVSGTTRDALIDFLIAEVSDEAEKYLRRHTEAKRRTEVYQLKPDREYLSLDGMPVDVKQSIAIHYSTTRDFSGIDPLTSSDYQILADEAQVYFHSFGEGSYTIPGFVQVNYFGGMAVDTATFLTAFPRIAGAVTREVVNRLNRAAHPEGNLKTLSASSVAFEKPLESLQDFYAALDHNRRLCP